MESIFEKCIKGDKEAFIQIISKMERKLYIIAKSKLDNEEDVKDVIQETIYLAFKNIKKLKQPDKFEAWVITILINNCKSYYKNKIVKVPFDESFIDEIEQEESIGNNLDFFNLINLLSDDDEKTIFTLFYLDDYTTNQISNILKINENTVKSKLKRSREKIKKYIERCGGNE